MVAASDVERAFGLGHASYTLLVFALPLLLAAPIEAPIALLSDRVERRRVLAAGLGALSGSLGCARSPSTAGRCRSASRSRAPPAASRAARRRPASSTGGRTMPNAR